MSRLEWLQMKRACASYGPPLTPYEQIELFRLETEHADLCGRRVDPGERLIDRRRLARGTPAGR